MFVDKIKIYIKAGDGGDGCTSFHTEKYVRNGGPDGGDGGKGGDIIFEATASKNNLVDFFYQNNFKAENGKRGDTKKCSGKSGKDLVIRVPCGTVMRDEKSGAVIADFFEDGQQKVILRGGSGGKGNARFATATRQSPNFSQRGYQTRKYCVVLELMSIADVGLLGYPNVGKSTLLSVISSAKPKIADYHFTTLTPNLAVAEHRNERFLVADIPGLIEGASQGAGLGHEFLRHIARTRMLIHMVDISGFEGRDPVNDYKTINAELKRYDEQAYKLPQIIALTKADLLNDDGQAVKAFKEKVKKPVFVISSITGQGVKELLDAVLKKLQSLPPVEPIKPDDFEFEVSDPTEFIVEKIGDGYFFVSGGMMEKLARNVVLNDPESFRYFQKYLRDKGVIQRLYEMGLKDGDTIKVLDVEFDFVE